MQRATIVTPEHVLKRLRQTAAEFVLRRAMRR
jgi:hypothetical protein